MKSLNKHAQNFLNQYPPKSSARINYGYILAHYLAYLKRRQIQNVNMLRIEQYLLTPTHAKRRPSNHYINLRLTTLRAFYTYLQRHNLTTDNPTQFIKSQRTPQSHSQRTLSPRELRYILRHTTGNAHLAIKILIHTGLRLAELANIRRNNLKPTTIESRRTYYLQITGKGQQTRNLHLPDNISQMLLAQFNKHKHLANTPLFPGAKPGNTLTTRSLYKLIKKQLTQIGFYQSSPHWFRHSFAQLASQKQDLLTTQQALGHANLNTTQRYLQKLKIIKLEKNLINID